MEAFTKNEVEEIFELAMAAGLQGRRDTLVQQLPLLVSVKMERDSRPGDQLRRDLLFCNRQRAESGNHLMTLWLEAAARMTNGLEWSARFRELARKSKHREEAAQMSKLWVIGLASVSVVLAVGLSLALVSKVAPHEPMVFECENGPTIAVRDGETWDKRPSVCKDGWQASGFGFTSRVPTGARHECWGPQCMLDCGKKEDNPDCAFAARCCHIVPQETQKPK